MEINAETEKLIKSFEGCRLRAYPDPATGSDPWTVGFGHTGPDVYKGLVITQAKADQLFEEDINKFAPKVARLIKVPVNPNQFGACASLTYNIGLGNFENSTLLRKLNAGDYAGAAAEFPKWDKANGKVMSGLKRRRKAEQRLFLSGSMSKTATPTTTSTNPLLELLKRIFNYFARSN